MAYDTTLRDLTLQELFKVRDCWNLLYSIVNTELYFDITHCQRFAALINMHIDELTEHHTNSERG